MTSAARPTFDPVKGGRGLKDDNLAIGGRPPSLHYSSKDQPGHTKLKYRNIQETIRPETMAKLASLEIPKSITHEPIINNPEPHIQDESEEDVDELLLELEKIKKERELKKEKIEKIAREEEIRTGNPLLVSVLSEKSNVDFRVKPRWDEDVVFRNQNVGSDVPKKKQFINDMIRSEFHRKFMDKYIK